MDRHNHLLSLAKKVELAYENWRNHPNDITCQRHYEMAKIELDNEVKHSKKISYLKHHH